MSDLILTRSASQATTSSQGVDNHKQPIDNISYLIGADSPFVRNPDGRLSFRCPMSAEERSERHRNNEQVREARRQQKKQKKQKKQKQKEKEKEGSKKDLKDDNEADGSDEVGKSTVSVVCQSM